jgi:lipopolysaccharide transport system permease protein
LANLEYRAIHRKKFFGIFWKFLNPLIFILIYTFVFSSLAGGSRGFIISTGILIISGISTTLNSSTKWIQEKILNFRTGSDTLSLYFASKVYFNFIPIFYLLPILVIIQRLVFNNDFQFTIQESTFIFFQTFLLVIGTMIYCFVLSIPLAIICKKFTDIEDLISHLVRIFTYLSPILWVAKTGNFLIDTILQLINPFYLIFETLNFIIYREYNFAMISIVTPILICFYCLFFYFKDDKYVKAVMDSLYL